MPGHANLHYRRKPVCTLTREVLSSARIEGNAVGIGFRNYWFRVVKDAEKGLGRIK